MARQITPPAAWDAMVRAYAQFRTLREKGQTEEDKAKKDILGYLADRGQETPEGHRVLASERVRVGKKYIIGFKRQRRVSLVLDQDKAIAWLEAHGLLAECQVTETVTYFNEDALIGLNFSEKIPDDVFKGFYTEKENFALILEEDPDDDEDE
jgi:hypothetical protein